MFKTKYNEKISKAARENTSLHRQEQIYELQISHQKPCEPEDVQ